MLYRTSTIRWHRPQPWRGGFFDRAIVTDAIFRTGGPPGVLYRYRRGTEFARAGPPWLARLACLYFEISDCQFIRWGLREEYWPEEHRAEAMALLRQEAFARYLKNQLRAARAGNRSRWVRALFALLLSLMTEPESIESAARGPPAWEEPAETD